MATVSARISSSSSPFSHAAISHAESCSSGIALTRRARHQKTNLISAQRALVPLLADQVDHVDRGGTGGMRVT